MERMEKQVLRTKGMASITYAATCLKYCTMSMSMLDIYDMMKELGYVVPHEIFWQEPGDRLKNIETEIVGETEQNYEIGEDHYSVNVEEDSVNDETDQNMYMSKSHFSTRCKSDMLLNNLSESFNKMILESRDKPILTMMEMIRSKIMTRIVSKKEQAEKINGLLCPKIQKKLENAIGQSIRCWPRAASANKYEVSAGPIDQHVVNLDNHSCSCRKWDLTGIPCMHAISVILMRQERPENYVSHYYSKDMQLQIYSNMVKPLRGPKQWANHGPNETVIPPIIRRPVGRPKKTEKKKLMKH
ncbi:hypothetical protein GQ457_12G008710 [Hibiscus cannabinus]